MPILLTEMTEESVAEFCDNLKASLIEAIRLGRIVTIDTGAIADQRFSHDAICRGIEFKVTVLDS